MSREDMESVATSIPFPKGRYTAWMQEVRLQDVTGRVESGTETENNAGSSCRGWGNSSTGCWAWIVPTILMHFLHPWRSTVQHDGKWVYSTSLLFLPLFFKPEYEPEQSMTVSLVPPVNFETTRYTWRLAFYTGRQSKTIFR